MNVDSPMRGLAMGWLAIAAGLTASAATAGTTNYLVTGQLGVASLGDDESFAGLDNSTFELRLTYDEPTQFDPELSSFGAQTFVYVAEAWSLAFLDDDGLIVEYDGKSPGNTNLTLGNSYGYVSLTGAITGFDSGETLLEVGVAEAVAAGDGQRLEPMLLRAEFYEPELIDAVFTDQLIDIPTDLAFQDGEALDESRNVKIDVVSASLAAVSIDDGIVIQVSGEDGDPSAIPTPSAAAGGALLLFGLMARRRRAVTPQA